eukprot:TRINITY_DN65004_c0_g1_i1.p1 TRINITY_DN65004_c0_g1~~TRINITY_DN65004_c0_g1_i1.p1  ORF type:complete len:118 (-),score=37.24 TRINITY_DN65004_c0_g1_i1:94-447(-)
MFFFFQAEDGIRDAQESRGLGDVYKRQGVTKLMRISEAKRLCPEMVLRCGEDLTPYRQFSNRVATILERYGVVERVGMDETVVELSRSTCLLYTSDAADEEDSVDLGGRRIIKKKTN